MRLFLLAILVSSLAACAANPPQTVQHVDLNRYAGTWYEIATIPQSFQKGCTGVTATYTPRPDGTVEVVNRCRQGTLNGPERSVKGAARVVDPNTNAKLKVSFFWPFEGDYWIFRLNDNYTTAAVGSPDYKTLWILHRQPQMSDAEYTALLRSLQADGFAVEKLQRTTQFPAPQNH